MCTCKTIAKRTIKIAAINAQEYIIPTKGSILLSNQAHPQESQSIPMHDNFEAYSTRGVVYQEFEAFGITNRRRPPTHNSGTKGVRKSRVSTEIHPDLLMAELLRAEE